MKHFWKKLLSFGLIVEMLLTGIPPVAAMASNEVAPVAQTSSIDWKELLDHSKPTLPEEGTYAPNRLIVTSVDSGMRTMSLNHKSIIGTDTLFSLDMPKQAQEALLMNTEETEKITCTAVNLLKGSDMLAVMNDLSEAPGVLAVEVDRLHTLDSVVEGAPKAEPDPAEPTPPEPFEPAKDPFVAKQTWLEFMGATKAWDMVTAEGNAPGEGVVVGVLDTGITTDHPDLEDQIAEGGRAFWLDTTVKPNVVKSSSIVDDRQGHGTHVSGMIAGAKNGTGITGVAYGAKILPIKVLNDEDGSGYDSAITVGMLYAAGLVNDQGKKEPKDTPARCDIMNMSLGGNVGKPSAVYEITVAAVREAGVFLVVAAGNEETATSYVNPGNLYAPYSQPAYVSGAFAVMAMQEKPRKDSWANGDYLTDFSNWDSDPYAGAEYTIMAPGSGILSSSNEKDGWYAVHGGTSMACPATAGAAALVLGAYPDYSAEDLWSVLATSGQKLQGKTDAAGNKYSYHMLDVVAALNTNPDSVKSVIKGNATGNWNEAKELAYLNNSNLVIPTNGSKPQIKLTLQGYDGEADKISANGAGLESNEVSMPYLAPGSEAELVFTLEKMPTTNVFETTINVTWSNKDGSVGNEAVPVKLNVVKAAPGAKLIDESFDSDTYSKQGIEILWIFKDEVNITLPNEKINAAPTAGEPADPELLCILLEKGGYYFGENGSLNVTKSDVYGSLGFAGGHMVNPQISGDVNMWRVDMQSLNKQKESSTINITGIMLSCTIDNYANLDLTVNGRIERTRISNSAGCTITADTVCNSTLMNNFTFEEPEGGNDVTEITVTEPTAPGTESAEESDSTGFYGNAVIGPAKVWYDDSAGVKDPVLAEAGDCYYLPTAIDGDNEHGLWVPEAINKLECDEGTSEVYVEGESVGDRPDILKNCPTFLISTKRVPNEKASQRDWHLSYRMVSEFSNEVIADEANKYRKFGYCSKLIPDGSVEAENIVWAADGMSCNYTVYTNYDFRNADDIYAIKGLGLPLQYDARNLIHDRKDNAIALTVTARMVTNEAGDREFEVSWNDPAGYSELKSGKLFCKDLSDKSGEASASHVLEQTELTAKKAIFTYNEELPEGTQYKIWAELKDKDVNPEYIAKGTALYYEPYAITGEDIDLRVDKLDASNTLKLSGRETATLTLLANKSFNTKNGLKITLLANNNALEITSVVPGNVAFSGIARDGDKTVIEIAPSGVFEGTKCRDQFVFKGDTIATLTIQGKNVADDGVVMLHLQDFLGRELQAPAGGEDPFTFAFDTKTTAFSYDDGDVDYTPPTNNTTTQTMPDGTLVTTTTNPDGSFQIVYRRTDGVSSTVQTPAKGAASTASISLPQALAGTGTKVQIPVPNGSNTTVAVLVGADGKEQVIPGSFWKDGVLTVPLTGNANIIIRDNAKTFGDVAADHWAANAIAFVTSHGLFNGDDKGFQPSGDTTRGMLVTVLARLDGQNTAAGARWDSVGTAWAKQLGISDGIGMEASITREQLAVMLYRYAKADKVKGDLSAFSDAANVSPWAQDAMEWAVKTGILNGANGAINPQNNASRAEVAAMLARFVANL